MREVFRKLYTGPIVTYAENASEGGLLAANAFSGKDTMQVTVEGNEDRILLIARYDNLGKGASGAAVECMNMVMGADPAEGLAI